MVDKKALRRFAEDSPAPAIPAGHGLLHAQQVKHIIRTAVKLIGHRRTLVLYVYDRKRAVSGDPVPVWTMFQAGGDYITLTRREDGSTCWREAAFERLGKDCHFTEGCAFYSLQDERRVREFFHDHDHGGIAALECAQWTITDRRRTERQLRREKRTIARMRPLHALPRGLEGWVRRSIMPAYFRCEHTSASRTVCPHCKRELTVKSAGKMGRHFDRDTVQVIEKIDGAEVVVRIVKVYYGYDREHLMPTVRVHENARTFVRRGPDGKVSTESYYFAYNKGTLTHWMPGNRPVYYKYGDNFEASIYGHVYCRNLPGALAGTPWEYCPVTVFYEHFREPMQMWPFLAAHVEHPRLEHLIKVGFYSLASDLAYGRARDVLDEARVRTHRLLGVAAEDVAFLRDLDVGAEALRMFQPYADRKDRQRLFLWQREHGVELDDIVRILEHMTPHKLMKYAEQQFQTLSGRKNQNGWPRYRDMQSVVSECRDYLDMCVKLNYDMGSSFVLYPKDLQQAHDRVARRVKIKADAQMRQDFKAAMRAISGHLDFEADGMKLVLPTTMEELAAEGNALHHCVGSSADRVARKECIILFLRQCGELDKPFYTVEVRGRKIVQVRGMRNCDATPEVEAFMGQWERQVLRNQALPDAA